MKVNDRIKSRRKELGLSAEDVAKALGVDRATVYRYESADIEKLPASVLEPIAKILQTTPYQLMGWENEKPATAEDDGLSETQAKLIELVKTMPDDQVIRVYRIVQEALELGKQ